MTIIARWLRARSLSARERAELEWWRHFRTKCGPNFLLRPGEPLLGRRFAVMEWQIGLPPVDNHGL